MRELELVKHNPFGIITVRIVEGDSVIARVPGLFTDDATAIECGRQLIRDLQDYPKRIPLDESIDWREECLQMWLAVEFELSMGQPDLTGYYSDPMLSPTLRQHNRGRELFGAYQGKWATDNEGNVIR